MTADSGVDNLLDRWEDLRDRGKELTPEELCADCPELLEPIRQYIRVLKKMNWMTQAPENTTIDGLSEVGKATPTPNEDPLGTLGEYTLEERIGAGGMGQVFKAVHRRMDRTVALKILPGEAVASPRAVQRFQREVRAAAKLIHPNIVTAYDAGEQEGTHFLVMEYVQGSDLHAHVKRHGPLPVDRAVGCVLQAAPRGLQYAHEQGVIHRDVKPGNLLLASNGTVKMLDMGLARLQAPASQDVDAPMTPVGAVLGTPDYLAPEQSLDAAAADHRADVYSLGCTLYFLLTGKSIYEGNTIMKKIVAHRDGAIPSLHPMRPDVPERVDAVFRKMVAKQPESRYQSMAEVLADLLSEAPVPSPPRRHKSLWAGGVLAAALLVVAGVGLFFGFILKVPVKGVGTVVVEINQPDVEVLVDGKKISIRNPKDKEPITIEVEDGKHELKVAKNGFETYTKAFRVKAGDKEAVKVRLEPNKVAVAPQPKTTEKGELKGLPADLTKNVSGTWSGAWEDSHGDKGEAVLFIKEQPKGSITGWLENVYKIENGRRVSSNEVDWESSNGDESFEVRGKIRDRGRTLLLLYAGAIVKKGKATSVVGVERLLRDGVEPYSDLKQAGWSGKWIGMYANSRGDVGDESLVVKELRDGKLQATWDDESTMKIEKVNDRLVRWEQIQPEHENRLYKAEVRLEGDTLRTKYTITYPVDSKKQGFTGAEWFIRD